MRTISEDKFESMFTMVKNHIDDNSSLDGCMFETYGEESIYVSSMEESKRVWTFMEDKKGLIFVTGIKPAYFLGPIGYFITDKPYTKELKVRLD
jgi:hypothetical protein